MITNTANMLTLFRIAIIPVLIVLFFFPGPVAAWSAVGLFVLAAITDFFDGYFARIRKEVSNIIIDYINDGNKAFIE